MRTMSVWLVLECVLQSLMYTVRSLRKHNWYWQYWRSRMLYVSSIKILLYWAIVAVFDYTIQKITKESNSEILPRSTTTVANPEFLVGGFVNPKRGYQPYIFARIKTKPWNKKEFVRGSPDLPTDWKVELLRVCDLFQCVHLAMASTERPAMNVEPTHSKIHSKMLNASHAQTTRSIPTWDLLLRTIAVCYPFFLLQM